MSGSSLEAAVTRAIWDELERQADRFGCVDRDTGLVDSGVDMDRVAAAVIEALGEVFYKQGRYFIGAALSEDHPELPFVKCLCGAEFTAQRVDGGRPQ